MRIGTTKEFVARTPAAGCGIRLAGLFLAGAVLSGAGCLQIEARIKYNEDGTSKLTERIFFSERLLDLAGDKRKELAALLSRERVVERMKSMGDGLTLLSHKIREGGDGWMESVAEISIPDLNKFRYVSPWLAFSDYAENNAVRAQVGPRTSGLAVTGAMVVDFVNEKPAKGQPAPPKNAPAPAGPTPREQQVYRDIAPVLRDMLKGFRLRFTFESYAPVYSGMGVRGAGAKAIDLLDISDSNMDQWGGFFLENEEVMVELARGEFWGPNVVRHVQGYDRNLTLPVFFPTGSPYKWYSWGPAIWFQPSKALFDKHFAGKMLEYERGRQVPARFEDIGWQGWKKDKGAEEKKPATGSEGGGTGRP